MMLARSMRLAALPAAMALLAASVSSALAQKKYDTGATDTEIKIGNIILIAAPHLPMERSARPRPPIST
jgi:branched-chain amino acid transport system substrate-binding protein